MEPPNSGDFDFLNLQRQGRPRLHVTGALTDNFLRLASANDAAHYLWQFQTILLIFQKSSGQT